jgi:Ca2+-transporting ATPase
MITGDHVKTAFAIANRLNITNDINETITKKELDKLTDKELFENIEKYKVYSRVNPLDKVRIVNAWKEKGHIVAMTGDGVNDAPALNSADIGCAMGSGTEIAKDASDIIIVDSNYNTIVKAISNGRNIYNNIKNCCKYLLASNIGEVLTIILITLLSLFSGFNFGIPLASIQLLWINVITDSLPAFGLGLVEDSSIVMKMPPRKNNEGFFVNGVAQEILFIGCSIGLLTVISYLIGFRLNPMYSSTMQT